MKAWGTMLVAAFIALPGTAAAEPGHFVSVPRDHAKLRFQGSNGYRFEVEANAGPNSHPEFSIRAKKGPAAVIYFVRGSLTSDGSIDVHLPHVGRLAVEFDPDHVTHRRVPSFCKGHPSIVESGYFRGQIELRGERDFTTVERSSTRGRLVHSSRQVCKFRAAARRASLNRKGAIRKWSANTSLTTGPKHGFASFSAQSPGFGFTDAPSFLSIEFDLREGMTIFRSIIVEGKADDFAPPELGKPKVVKVTPPAPFKGSATFTLISPKKSTWAGDLSVEMPGSGRVQLAGTGFWSELCEGSHCTGSGEEHISQISGSAV